MINANRRKKSFLDGIPENHIIRFAFDSADDLSLIGENLIEFEKNGKKVDPRKIHGIYPKQNYWGRHV